MVFGPEEAVQSVVAALCDPDRCLLLFDESESVQKSTVILSRKMLYRLVSEQALIGRDGVVCDLVEFEQSLSSKGTHRQCFGRDTPLFVVFNVDAVGQRADGDVLDEMDSNLILIDHRANVSTAECAQNGRKQPRIRKEPQESASRHPFAFGHGASSLFRAELDSISPVDFVGVLLMIGSLSIDRLPVFLRLYILRI